ncbi:MAG: hypothetical protein AAF320_00670, partial [Myxococcota bacterium]
MIENQAAKGEKMKLKRTSYVLLGAFLALQACGEDKKAKKLTEPKKAIAEIQEDAKNTSEEGD